MWVCLQPTDKVDVYVGDGERMPEGFVRTGTYAEALEMLRKGNVRKLSIGYRLDGECGEEPCTGVDVVGAICYENLYAEEIYIHEREGVARARMHRMLVTARSQRFISERMKIYPFEYRLRIRKEGRRKRP